MVRCWCSAIPRPGPARACCSRRPRRWRCSIAVPRNRTSRPTARPSSCSRRGSALGQAEARPGGVLVPVRHLYSLSHVRPALQAAGDRDVVVMTVRVLGVDVEDDADIDRRPTPAEQLLLSQVVALAERHNRAVQLLIVPARDVFDAIADGDAPAAIVGNPRRRVDDAVGRRAGAAARRGLGAARADSRSTCASSSIIRAAGPTSIISAPTRRRSHPAISTRFIVSGSTPRRRSAPRAPP